MFKSHKKAIKARRNKFVPGLQVDNKRRKVEVMLFSRNRRIVLDEVEVAFLADALTAQAQKWGRAHQSPPNTGKAELDAAAVVGMFTKFVEDTLRKEQQSCYEAIKESMLAHTSALSSKTTRLCNKS